MIFRPGLYSILQTDPSFDKIVNFVMILFSQSKFNSKAPLAQTPLNSPSLHSSGNAGNNFINPSCDCISISVTAAVTPKLPSTCNALPHNANNEVQAVASMKSVTMPTSMSDEYMKKLNDLREKSGKDFDKDYISMVVDEHKKTVNNYEKMASDSKDVLLGRHCG